MVNEKMKILKMLEEGRISAEDAAKLLEGAAPGSGAYSSPPPPAPRNPGTPYEQQSHGTGYAHGSGSGYASSTPPGAGYGPASNDNGRRPGAAPGGRAPSPGRGTGGTVNDLGKRLENFLSDMEPKIQRIAGIAAEKASHAADAISKSFSSPPRPAPPYHAPHTPPGAPHPRPQAPAKPAPPSPASSRGRIERSFELKVSEMGSELIIDGLNGQVLLKGYNGDKITAKVYYTAKRANANIDLVALGSKYYLNYDENDFDSVSVDAYIPETMFQAVRVTNIGGPLVVSTVRAANARFENQNGDVEITGFTADNLLIETNNGNMRLHDISSEKAEIDDFNGAIAATDLDISQMKMVTFNGGITMQIASFARFSEYKWSIESNNGKMSMMLPSSLDTGYHVRANAALSEVRLGLTGLSFISNSKTFAEAESTNFDHAAKKVTMVLETSSAPLVIN